MACSYPIILRDKEYIWYGKTSLNNQDRFSEEGELKNHSKRLSFCLEKENSQVFLRLAVNFLLIIFVLILKSPLAFIV